MNKVVVLKNGFYIYIDINVNMYVATLYCKGEVLEQKICYPEDLEKHIEEWKRTERKLTYDEIRSMDFDSMTTKELWHILVESDYLGQEDVPIRMSGEYYIDRINNILENEKAEGKDIIIV